MTEPGVCLFLLRRRCAYQRALDEAINRLNNFPPIDLDKVHELYRLIHVYSGMIGWIDRQRSQALVDLQLTQKETKHDRRQLVHT